MLVGSAASTPQSGQMIVVSPETIWARETRKVAVHDRHVASLPRRRTSPKLLVIAIWRSSFHASESQRASNCNGFMIGSRSRLSLSRTPMTSDSTEDGPWSFIPPRSRMSR